MQRVREARGGTERGAGGGGRPRRLSRAEPAAPHARHDALSRNKCVLRGTSRERIPKHRLITVDSVSFCLTEYFFIYF